MRVDCLEGEHAADEGDWSRAWELLRGNFLEGFSIPESREFEEWAESQRTRFRDLRAAAGQAVAEQLLREGNAERAHEIALELVQLRPFDDAATRLLMAALAALGRYATAVARFHAYTELLKAEFEDEPGAPLKEYASELEASLRSRPPPSALELPFVGRAAEWAELEAAWQAAEASESSLALIEGAAGLGKTRLLAELGGRVAAGNALSLSAKCYEIERGVPYSAVAETLSDAVTCPELRQLSPAWLAEAARILPELRDVFPDLPELPGVEGSEASKRRLHQAAARFIEALADSRSVLVSVDDIHWADPASLEVLHFLSHRLRGRRVLIVATYRPAELSLVARRFTRSLCATKMARLVALNPLTPEATGELLASLGRFSDASVAAAIGEHLHRHSGGNPLFLSELLEALARDRILLVRAGRWTLAPDAEIDELPRTLGKLMGDRVDALAPWMRALVETLAVASEEVPVELLATALDISEPRVELALSVLEEERLCRRVGYGTFELVHDELRRLVHQGIPDERRRVLHAVVGRALEAHGAERRPGGAARLAYHFEQAEDPRRAHRYALLAAGEAGALGEAEAERAHLEVAAAHSARALPPGSSPSPPGRGWRRFGGRRAALAAGLAVAAVALVGGFQLRSSFSESAGTADYRQGTLYLTAGGLHAPTHGLAWPRSADEPARLVELPEPLDGFPPTLFVANVSEAGETHNKIFMVQASDTVQLTFGRTDDMGTAWAPNGRFFVLTRGWKASETHFQQNLFLLDSAGRVLQQITDTKYQDNYSTWSPIGTQLAFVRDSGGTSSIWLADADGANARNLSTRFGLPGVPGLPSFSSDGSNLGVVYPDTGSGLGVIYIVDFVAERARPLSGPRRSLVLARPSWSPDGRWLAYATASSDTLWALWVEPIDGGAGPTLVATLPANVGVSEWINGEARYAASVEIDPTAVSVRTGYGVRASASVRTRDGEPLSTNVRWAVADTSVARVDDVGFVRGRSPGATVLTASAGGFVSDTVPVKVVFAPVDTLFFEDWSEGLDTTRWTPFGQPRPVVVHNAERYGPSVFLNNGDYNHGSGAVSIAELPLSDAGLTLEVQVRVDFTGQHWQNLEVSLLADRPLSLGTEFWSGPAVFSLSGHSPTRARPGWDCGPGGANGEWDPASINRRWLSVAIQVRPDGYAECALDGTVVGKGTLPPAAEGRPLSVVLRGQSEGTELYHGRVVVTRGLRY